MLPKLWVVAVLFAPATIARGYLQMPILVRADPYVRPRGRNDERAKSPQCVARANHLAVGTDVREAASVAVTTDSRHGIGNVSKARREGGSHVFVSDGLAQLSSPASRARWSRTSARRAGRASRYGRERRAAATVFRRRPRLAASIASWLTRSCQIGAAPADFLQHLRRPPLQSTFLFLETATATFGSQEARWPAQSTRFDFPASQRHIALRETSCSTPKSS